MPILRRKLSIMAVMKVTTPKPPIWISSRMTICPNTLQVETVGTVTRPVTQTEVVAVNRASTKETDAPLTVLKGSMRSSVPMTIAARKANMIVCVEENRFLFFTPDPPFRPPRPEDGFFPPICGPYSIKSIIIA